MGLGQAAVGPFDRLKAGALLQAQKPQRRLMRRAGPIAGVGGAGATTLLRLPLPIPLLIAGLGPPLLVALPGPTLLLLQAQHSWFSRMISQHRQTLHEGYG